MKPEAKKLLNLMFREGETICVQPNQYACQALPLDKVLTEEDIPLVPGDSSKKIRWCKSDELLLVALNPIKGQRNDSNCYKYRNFLIEIDDAPIAQQMPYIKQSGIPYSAAVFSGGKSFHTLIALEEDLTDEKTYRHIGRWILNVLTFADENIQNPSRCIRIPGAIRDNGNKQRLFEIGERIKFADLKVWLEKHRAHEPKYKERKKVGNGDTSNYDTRLSEWARKQLTEGIKFTKGRNSGWFALAVDMAQAGYPEELTIAALSAKFTEEHDFREKEFLSIIAKAYKYVEEQ